MAAAVGLFLVWYAAWTLICNAAVLLGIRYATIFPQAVLVPTVLTLAASRLVSRTAAAHHGPVEAASVPSGFPRAWLAALAIAVGGTASVFAVVTLEPPGWTSIAAAIMVGSAIIAALLVARCGQGQPAEADRPAQGWWRYVVLFGVLLALYYFGHRQDEDESNFVNLALGAQRTRGAIYQFDTMLGDGPHAIHLATYKLHSFELLIASLSSLLKTSPIIVGHLILPVPQLALIAGVVWLLLEPVVGRRWLAAGLLLPAVLLVDTQYYSTWGLNGIVRLFEGKALLVTAMTPLIAGLTVRWFEKRAGADLVALGLAQACAVGLSANGVYIGPFASGFVALAYLAARPTASTMAAALRLVPTLAYPAAAAGVVILGHLGHPSEVPWAGVATLEFMTVAGGHSGGAVMAMLVATLLLGIGFAHTRARGPATAYMPVVLAATLNPASWAVISAFTGMLGYRIFWALPVPMMIAALLTVVAVRAGIRREETLIAAAAATLLGAIWVNTTFSEKPFLVHWHRPTLKVDREQYGNARALAAITAPTCSILAPESVSQWLSTIEAAPYPVFTRRLYLEHYRFSMPAAERATRTALADVVDKGAPADGIDLRSLQTPIGTVAVMRDSGARHAAAGLAQRLGLSGPVRVDTMLIWKGACKRP